MAVKKLPYGRWEASYRDPLGVSGSSTPHSD